MFRMLAGSLIISSVFVCAAYANQTPDALYGKWDVRAHDGKQVAVYEFGSLRGGTGELTLTGADRHGEIKVYRMSYQAQIKGSTIVVQPKMDGRDSRDLDCMTVEFVSADEARIRQHRCNEAASGQVGTMRRVR